MYTSWKMHLHEMGASFNLLDPIYAGVLLMVLIVGAIALAMLAVKIFKDLKAWGKKWREDSRVMGERHGVALEPLEHDFFKRQAEVKSQPLFDISPLKKRQVKRRKALGKTMKQVVKGLKKRKAKKVKRGKKGRK